MPLRERRGPASPPGPKVNVIPDSTKVEDTPSGMRRIRSLRRLATIELSTMLHGPDAIPPDLPPGPEWCPPWCPSCATDWWWVA